MKNIVFAIGFAAFSLGLPLLLATQAVAQEEVTEQSNANIEKNDKGIRIDIDLSDSEDASEEIRSMIDLVSDLVSEEMAAELSSELSALEQGDRQELQVKLKKLMHGKEFSFQESDDGMGIEILIPILGIIFTLGMPVIILLLVFTYGYRKRKQKMELINYYLEAGQPVPEHVMAEFGSNQNMSSPFRNGATLLLVGIAIAIFLGTVAEPELATVGLIPAAIGIARLLSWKYDKQQSDDSL